MITDSVDKGTSQMNDKGKEEEKAEGKNNGKEKQQG